MLRTWTNVNASVISGISHHCFNAPFSFPFCFNISSWDHRAEDVLSRNVYEWTRHVSSGTSRRFRGNERLADSQSYESTNEFIT